MDVQDLLVLEVGDARTSMAGRLLRDLGLEIVRIEPESPHSAAFGPFSAEGTSLYQAFYNCGKQIIPSANPAQTIRRAIDAAPAKRPLIIVAPEDFPAGNAPRGTELARRYPGALVVELLDFGVYRGPRRYANISVAARGGQMAVCGREDRPPLVAPGHQPVNLAGLYAAITALSAAIQSPDQGCLATISLQACVAASIENALVAYFAAGRVQRRQGFFHWSRNSFVGETTDGHILAMLLLDWNTLIAWLASEGMEGDLADPIYGDPLLRRQQDSVFQIAQKLAPWIATKPTAALLEEAHARRFPWSEVAAMGETARSDHFAERGFIAPSESEGGASIAVASPILWGDATHPRGTRRGLLAPDARPAAPPTETRRADQTQSNPASALPLAGITILDFTWVLAGPFATRILADLGATVIKVQRPETGGAAVNRNDSSHFRAWNRNKLGIALDVNTPAGRAEAVALLTKADAVVDNFSARVMPNWGFDFDQLLAINPRLVAVSMSGFGRSGPWRDRVSYGPTLQALSGATSLMRVPGDGPTGFGFSYADHVGGTVAAYATVAALAARDRSGKGLWIDLAQLEAVAYLFGPELLASLTDPAFAPRGNQDWHDRGALTSMLECAGDEWIAASIFDHAGLETLFETIGSGSPPPDLAAARADWQTLEQALAPATRALPRPLLLARLQAAGLEAQPVLTADGLAADADLLGADFFWAVEGAMGRDTLDGLPLRFTPPRAFPRRGAPTVGQHQETMMPRTLTGAAHAQRGTDA